MMSAFCIIIILNKYNLAFWQMLDDYDIMGLLVGNHVDNAARTYSTHHIINCLIHYYLEFSKGKVLKKNI